MRKKTLSFDLNLVNLCETGYWFCTRCQKITEPVERGEGLLDGCLFCGFPNIKWNSPISEIRPWFNPDPVVKYDKET